MTHAPRALPRALIRSSVILFALASCWAGTVSAASIHEFKVQTVNPDDIESRFGTTAPFGISLAECRYFLSVEDDLCTLTSADSTDTTDTTDSTDGTDTADTTDSTDTTDTTDGTAVVDATDGSDTTDTTDGTDATDTTDGTDATDTTDGSDATDTTDGTDATDTTDGTDATDTTDGTDATDTTDGTDATDTTDGTDIPAGSTAPGKADTSASTSITLTVSMATTDATSVPHDQLGWAVGTSCSESAPPENDSENCRVIQALKTTTSFTNVEIKVPLADILGDDCQTANTVYVYVYAKNKPVIVGTAETITVSKIEFNPDYAPPSGPSISGVAEGEENVTVSWTDLSTEDGLTHKVYWADHAFASGNFGDSDVSGSGEISADGSYQVTGLENGKEYYFAVTALDDSGNESTVCSENLLMTGTPRPLDDFYEYYKKAGGNEEGGFTFCFVATAAWGSPLAPAVNWLRAFRDQRMMASGGGQALVALYEQVGPKAAAGIAQSEALRAVARLLLWPLVGLVMIVMAAPIWGPAAAFLTWLGFRSWTRRRGARADRKSPR